MKINLDKIDEFITDKKILEIVEIIKQSFPFTFIGRQKIRRVIDQLDFAFWIKDPNKKFIIVNKFFAESVGVSLNKIEGQHLQDVLVENEAKLALSIDEYIVSSSNAVVYESYSKTFSKETVQNIEFPICDLEKNVVAIIGYNLSIEDTEIAQQKDNSITSSNYDSLPYMLVEIDQDYNIIGVSNKFLFEFGLVKNEIVGGNINEILNTDLSIIDDNKNNFVKIANSEYEVEKSIIQKDNKISGRFISFNKSIEKKQTTSGSMYDIIMQYSSDPMYVYSIENLKFLKVNEAALKLYGYTENEFLEMDLTDLYAPEDIQTLVESSSRDTVEHGFTGPWRHTSKDGSTVLVEISKMLIDFDGIRSHFNTIKDLSKEQQSQKQLQKYKMVYENTNDLLIITDKEGFITESNSRVSEELNIDKNLLKEKSFLSLVNDKDRGKINTSIFHANNIQPIKINTELKQANDESLPVTIHSTPFFNREDEVESFGLVIITKVENIVEQMTQQRPIKIVKESGNKINGDFLSNLFHELLTPINVIIGFAQELAESITEPNDEQKESVDIISDNQKTVVELMDNAIQYAQLIQHQVEITPTMVKFVDVIDTIENNVSKVSNSENVKFAYGKISSSLKFMTDRQKMITIISFLIEFAMKVTKNTKIYLSAYQNDAGHCVVSVKDERSSISSHLLTAMNDIFNGEEEEVRQKYGISRFMIRHARQLSDLLTEKKETITKLNQPVEYGYIFPIRYVDREGVIISTQKDTTMKVDEQQKNEVESVKESEKISDESKRSEIIKEEPVIENILATQSEVKQEIVEEVLPTEESQKLFSDIDCLYVEDQIDSQILFKVQMRDLKEIEFATSFEKAIPLLKSKHFDLIVMDINLQGEYNGLDAMRAIKRMPNYADTPIIAVTAYILPGDRERFIKAGFNDFISKPVLRDKLETVIQKVL
ncbi:MAG: PAS domain S-box protein [Bacteroidota bacterium]